MTAESRNPGDPPAVIPVFFLSDSTGISAETMGNALLIQFPDLHFERTLIPFISTREQAREVVTQLDEAMAGPVPPRARGDERVPSAQARSRSLKRWILPVAVLGSSSMNSTTRGYL